MLRPAAGSVNDLSHCFVEHQPYVPDLDVLAVRVDSVGEQNGVQAPLWVQAHLCTSVTHVSVRLGAQITTRLVPATVEDRVIICVPPKRPAALAVVGLC